MMRHSLHSLHAVIGARGKAEFLVQPGGRFSYAQLGDAISRWLARFDAAGLAEGDRLPIRSTDDFMLSSCLIAALLDGLVPVPLAQGTPDASLLATARTVAAKAVVLDAAAAALQLDAAMARIALAPPGETRRGWLGLSRASDPLAAIGPPGTRAPRLPEGEDALAYLLFTSGTTSSPCGAMVTRANLLEQLATLSRLFGHSAESRIFNDMAIAHADGLIQGPLLALANGAALVRSGGFHLDTLESWLDRVRQERATHVIAVPTIWAMIEAYAAHDDYFDAPECRALLSVAAKLPGELWERLEERFRRPVFNQYGLTETVTSALYAGPHPEMGARGTIGLPVDCAARIDPAAANGEGELQLKGSNVFAGYWRNTERSRACFTDDGWFRTGDLARRAANGSYEILGRSKHVIMMGGLLIRPDEIDEAMLAHPQVRESVTVGLADAMFDEVPVTAVVCREPLGEAALTAHARSRLDPRKVPRRIVALAAIPRGISGKPQLSALRELLAGMHGAAAQEPAESGGDIEREVLALAGDIFRVAPDQLGLRTAPGDVPGWDSFSQLNFVLAAEQRFGVTIPAARVAAIRSIGGMVEAVRDLSG